MKNIFLKIIMILFVFLLCYILGVFIFPDFWDNYLILEYNNLIRKTFESFNNISNQDGTLNISF